MRWAVLLVPLLAGCFGFTTDEAAPPAPGPEPLRTVPMDILVLDSNGGAIQNATVTVPTHNITFVTSEAEVTVNLTIGPAVFQATHTHYHEREIRIELTNQSAHGRVILNLDRDTSNWSKAQRDVLSMTIDCSTPAGACPGSDGGQTVEVPITVRADFIALAHHGSQDIRLEATLGDWSHTFDGPGPHNVTADALAAGDTLQLVLTGNGPLVGESVRIEYVVARCTSAPPGWSLADPTGWDPGAMVPC